MTIDLSEVEFSYDFFSSTMPDGGTLVLNKVSESMLVGNDTVNVNAINIVIVDPETGENTLCSSVIGIGNDKILLSSEYTEYLGAVLTEDNMKYCTIEMYEEENE